MEAAETEERNASEKRLTQRNSVKEKDRSGNDIKKMKTGGGGNALKTERRVVFGGEGAQWWCQCEAVNTGPRLILQLSVVIKWERSRKPPSIQTLSLLLCQDQRMEHYCICNTAQLLKPPLLLFRCLACRRSAYSASLQALQMFSRGQIYLGVINHTFHGQKVPTATFYSPVPTSMSLTQHATQVPWFLIEQSTSLQFLDGPSSSTFGSSGLSLQHYSRPYIGIICTRLSRAQGTNPFSVSMSVSEFEGGGWGGGDF